MVGTLRKAVVMKTISLVIFTFSEAQLLLLDEILHKSDGAWRQETFPVNAGHLTVISFDNNDNVPLLKANLLKHNMILQPHKRNSPLVYQVAEL